MPSNIYVFPNDKMRCSTNSVDSTVLQKVFDQQVGDGVDDEPHVAGVHHASQVAVGLGSWFFGLFELLGDVLDTGMVVLRSGVIRERDSDGLSLHLFFEDVDLGEESDHGRVNKDFGIDDFGEEF